MDAHSLQFMTAVIDRELLGASRNPDGPAAEEYWAGGVYVPLAIEAYFEEFLANSDREALIRASLWIARKYALAGTRPSHHLSLVRWLFENGRIDVPELVELLAIESTSALDTAAVEIVLLARELVEEKRMDDAESTVLPMLMDYSPSL